LQANSLSIRGKHLKKYQLLIILYTDGKLCVYMEYICTSNKEN
jgi:hypothetical protein